MFLSGTEEEELHTNTIYLTRHLTARSEPQQQLDSRGKEVWHQTPLKTGTKNVKILRMAKKTSVSEQTSEASPSHSHTIRVRFLGQRHSCGGMILLFDDMLSNFADISHLVRKL